MSGNALPGCGTIHIDEVKPTLTKLSIDLEFPFDLNNYVLGSTGKKEYSGDVDVVLDTKWYSGNAKSLKKDANLLLGEENVALNGALLHIKYPIVNYDASKDGRQPRTGFVQVDFNFGDYDRLKLFYFSAGSATKFKGLHRNIALASIAGIVENISSVYTDDQGRPLEQVRWKWSPTGLIRVRRFIKAKSNGTFNKTATDQPLGILITDPEGIAKKLLHGKPEDMDSLETIVAAVKSGFKKEVQEQIFERMAKNFEEKDVVNGYEYTPEISKYFSVGDK